MFGKAQFAKSRKKKPFTSLILTWLSIMYEVCFLDTPLRLIGLIYIPRGSQNGKVHLCNSKIVGVRSFLVDFVKKI